MRMIWVSLNFANQQSPALVLMLQKDRQEEQKAWGDERFVNLLFLQKAALPRETGVTKPCMEQPKVFRKIIVFLN